MRSHNGALRGAGSSPHPEALIEAALQPAKVAAARGDAKEPRGERVDVAAKRFAVLPLAAEAAPAARGVAERVKRGGLVVVEGTADLAGAGDRARRTEPGCRRGR